MKEEQTCGGCHFFRPSKGMCSKIVQPLDKRWGAYLPCQALYTACENWQHRAAALEAIQAEATLPKTHG